jgi:hypothetical protein
VAAAVLAVLVAGVAGWWLLLRESPGAPARQGSPGTPASFMPSADGNWVGNPVFEGDTKPVNLHLTEGLEYGGLQTTGSACLSGDLTDIHGTSSRIEMSFTPESEDCASGTMTATLQGDGEPELVLRFDADGERPGFGAKFIFEED